MTTPQLLSQLRGIGAQIRVRGGHLEVSAPESLLTNEIRQGIAAREADILAFIRATTPGAGSPGMEEAARRRGPRAPVSFAQERIWLLEELGPKEAAFNIPLAWRLRGALEARALAAALAEISRRHEALRTTFTSVEGRPMQRFSRPAPVDLPVVDLRGLDGTDREDRARELIREEGARPFRLDKGPLVRQVLVRLSPDEHLLVIVVHHIVFDGWSLGVFLRELSALYEAFASGRPSPLGSDPPPYQDFCRWQRQAVSDPSWAAQIRWWQENLAGLPPVLDNLADRPRPPVQAWQGLHWVGKLPGAVSRGIAELGRQRAATGFMVLLAAWAAFLHRWTAQRDFAVGTPVANRPRIETEGSIGLFLNTLVMRCMPSAGMSFVELLAKVRATALGAFANQDIPFELLLEELQPERSFSHTPLFQVMLVVQTAPRTDLRLRGLTVEPVLAVNEGAKADLSLHVVDAGEEGITAALFANAEIFEQGTIDEMGTSFSVLLGAALERPQTRISDLPLIDGTMRPPRPGRGGPRPSGPFVPMTRDVLEHGIAARFERQVDARPSAIALRDGRVTWTYGDLDGRANAVARQIAARGAAGLPRIGLLLGHDAAMISGILGALKAGAAYVPLDPDDPPRRLAAIAERAGCSLVVACRGTADLAEGLRRDGVEIIDMEPGATAPRFSVPVPPEAPAYVLHTSGSTGEPKGIVQTHRNVLHFIRAYTNNLHIAAADRLSLVARCGFDAAVMDVFGALLNGASLHMFDLRERGFDPLPAWVTKSGITIWHSTPTVFRAFMEHGGRYPAVRILVLGGEAATRRDFDLFRRSFAPPSIMVNGLGPTESTVTLQYFADHDSSFRGQDMPVGRPVEETEVTLVDEHGEPQLQGEIAIRSRYVAAGYDGVAESPAFIPGRSAGEPRTFMSGDIGRLLPDGNIVFVGRRDSQVKIRGYRVEPGESEALLRAHPFLREAAVVARAGGLAAYVVARPGVAVGAGDLRAWLRERIPDSMVPSAFVFLPSLPLTRSGKIDAAALPPPGPAEERPAFVAPRNPAEEVVAQCWASILDVQRVGVHDNFFELGGSSLAATRIIARLREAFGVDLPLRTLFIEPTVEGVAKRFAGDPAESRWRFGGPLREWKSVVPIQPRGSRPPFFIVAGAHAEEEQFLRYLAHLVPALGTDQPVFGIRPRGFDGDGLAPESVEEMAREFVGELRVCQPRGPYLLGGECVGGMVAFEMARLLEESGARVSCLILMDTPVPGPATAAIIRVTSAARRFASVHGHLVHAFRVLTRSGAAEGAAYLRRVFARWRTLAAPRNEEELAASRKVRAARLYVNAMSRYRALPCGARVDLLVNERDSAGDFGRGWSRFARGGVETHVVPGDHVTRLTSHGREMAGVIRSCLTRAAPQDNRSPEVA